MFQAIAIEVFEERTDIRRADFSHLWDRAATVVSLRGIRRALAVQAMPVGYLSRLLTSVRLEGDSRERPYAGCDIQVVRVDPWEVSVGQSFVERAKYQVFIEAFSGALDGFCVGRGIAACLPMIVLGEIEDGTLAIAHYLPPIVEDAGRRRNLVDGIHRSFLVKTIGTTIESIVIRGVETPFPCETRGWDAVQIVGEKPPREERFFAFKPELFRDLKTVGIDG